MNDDSPNAPPQSVVPTQDQPDADIDPDETKKSVALNIAMIFVGFGMLAFVLMGHPRLETVSALIEAVSTAFIAWFTIKLTSVGRRQVRWMKQADKRIGDQIDLATNEFVAAHKPRLEVRSIGYETKTGENDLPTGVSSPSRLTS
jgi:hypothetical protein